MLSMVHARWASGNFRARVQMCGGCCSCVEGGLHGLVCCDNSKRRDQFLYNRWT